MRASEMAAAHMAQGSSVTHNSQPSRRGLPRLAAAWRVTTISAWAVGSSSPRIALRASAMTSPLQVTTAPTGTSPASAACAARSSARRIGGGIGKFASMASALARSEGIVISALVDSVGRRGLVVLGRLDFNRRHLDGDVLGLAANCDLAGFDVERGRLAPGRGDTDAIRGDSRRFGASGLPNVEKTRLDGDDQCHNGQD